MSTTCTRCEGTGFLNFDLLPEDVMAKDVNDILSYINNTNDTDVQVCDCCGDGYGWHGMPGEHYNSDDPIGNNGPYASNGGLCQCH